MFAFCLAIAAQCMFTPPAGWEIAQLKNPSPHIQIGFIGKGSTEFRPSMNLSIEADVDVSLKDYVKAVKELQTADPNTKWRDLGKLPMKAGTGKLIEMTNPSPWGEMKVFQAFYVEGETAYILTAAILKDDLPKMQAELLKSFQSLHLLSDVWAPAPGLFASAGSGDKEKEWKKLQEDIKLLPELGPYWQFLALQEGHKKIYQEDP